MLTDGSGRGDAAAALSGEGEAGVVTTLAGRRSGQHLDRDHSPVHDDDHDRNHERNHGTAWRPRTIGPAAGIRLQGGDAAEVRTLEPLVVHGAAHAWFPHYRRMLVATDLAAAAAASAVAFAARFGASSTPGAPATWVAALLLPVAWVALLALTRCYEERFLGIGTDEYERVFRSFLYLTALISFASYATKSEVARGFVVVALPCALLLDLGGRHLARRRLHAVRGLGRAMCPTIVVGDALAAAAFADRVGRDHRSGLLVVGACLTYRDHDDPAVERLAAAGIPVIGTPETVREAVLRSGASTVAVLSGVDPEQLRWIGRRLEETDADLVVSPGLTDVAGTRLHIRPVGELPLLHVERPELTGFRRAVKSTFDRVLASVALLVLAPLLLVTAVAVATTSRGPVLFRQERIGQRGKPFTMYKFRSMYADAAGLQAELAAFNDRADGPLFKIRLDPRVTRVGRVLRKYSVDELPQLVNVVKGDMSLVGPRPPLPDEVAHYRGDVRRRLLVKPGITGLWQVSGRSDLSWEESVRLDLRYVENWSLALDLSLLCRTAVAVVRANGAY